MALGPFGFHLLRFGYDGVSRDLSTSWASIQTVGGLDHLQWLGGDTDRVKIEGVVFPEEFGGLESFEGVRSAARDGVVLPLVTLGGNVFGMYVIDVVSESQRFHDAAGGIGAWNSHGNAEYCGAEGVFEGGITPGGNHMRFRGTIRTRAAQQGWAIFISGNTGFDFDFEDMEIETIGDPGSGFTFGVVDLSSQTTSGMNAYATKGGRINLNNVRFNCPTRRF